MASISSVIGLDLTGNCGHDDVMKIAKNTSSATGFGKDEQTSSTTHSRYRRSDDETKTICLVNVDPV